MALLIREANNSHEVYGSKTGKVYFTGSVQECEIEIKRRIKNFELRTNRIAMNDAMESLGMVKVRGAVSGNVYWE